MKCRFLSCSCQVTSQRRRRMFPLAGTNAGGPGKLNRKHDQQQTQINQPHIFQQRSCMAYYNALPPRLHRDSGSFKNAQPCLFVQLPSCWWPKHQPSFTARVCRRYVKLGKTACFAHCLQARTIWHVYLFWLYWQRHRCSSLFFHFPGGATEVQNVWKSTTTWSYTCIMNPFGGSTPTHKEYAWHKPHATQNPSSCPLSTKRFSWG